MEESGRIVSGRKLKTNLEETNDGSLWYIYIHTHIYIFIIYTYNMYTYTQLYIFICSPLYPEVQGEAGNDTSRTFFLSLCHCFTDVSTPLSFLLNLSHAVLPSQSSSSPLPSL